MRMQAAARIKDRYNLMRTKKWRLEIETTRNLQIDCVILEKIKKAIDKLLLKLKK